MDQFPGVVFVGGQFGELARVLSFDERAAARIEQRPLRLIGAALGLKQFWLADDLACPVDLDGDLHPKLAVRRAIIDEVLLDPELQRILLAAGDRLREDGSRAAGLRGLVQ